jgi:glycosyltransferase involved in cell wall biosynthesis
MQTLLVVTYVDFWKRCSGHRARINSLLNYLKDKIRITVFFAGVEKENEKILLNTIYPEINFAFAGAATALTFKEYKEKFECFIEDKFFDFALVEYIELSIVLEYLPETTITMLDTHDIVYSKIESFNTFNVEYDGIVLSKQEELNIFKCYDHIILIQKTDFENIEKEIDAANLLLIPHPAILEKKKIRKKAKNVGYIASPYIPNIDALKWFITNVWNGIYKKHDLVLNVYGNVQQGFLPALNITNNNIIFHGFVDDLEKVYDNLDIIVNPIRCGAGLKIKNVEALGYGIPLITTTHGASGIEDGASKAFLIADSPEEYFSAFDHVVKDYNLRKKISNKAFEYAQSNFSKEKCYAGLLQIIVNKP